MSNMQVLPAISQQAGACHNQPLHARYISDLLHDFVGLRGKVRVGQEPTLRSDKAHSCSDFIIVQTGPVEDCCLLDLLHSYVRIKSLCQHLQCMGQEIASPKVLCKLGIKV